MIEAPPPEAAPVPTPRCPTCHADALIPGEGELRCTACGVGYPLLAGSPVLLRPDNEVFRAADYAPRLDPGRRSRRGRLPRPSPSTNLARGRMLRRFGELLPLGRRASVLAVGAGHQGAELRRALGSGVDLVATDVAPDTPVDFYCDVHELPFGDGTFDGAIATAVLEHVVDPSRAVAEIRRVLRDGGVVYSEVPFLQQVHAGALDFTRFTLSGHRLLFRDFRELSSGTVAGPATTLVWALERFAGAAVPGRNGSKAARGLVRLLVFWLKYLDYVLPNTRETADGASCTYFLGVKEAGFSRSDADVVAAYDDDGRRP